MNILNNQEMPNENKKTRRFVDASPKSLSFDKEIKDKKANKFLKILSNIFKRKKEDDSVQEIVITDRMSRKGSTENQSSNVNTRRLSDTDKKSQIEIKKRRVANKRKSLILFGAGGVAIIAIIVVSIVSFGFKDTKANADVIDEASSDEMTVTIHLDDTTMQVHSKAYTIADLLLENEIELLDNQKLSHSMDTLINDGMEIFINNPIVIIFVKNDIPLSVTVHGSKVIDVLDSMDIEYEEHDIVEPSIDTLLEEDMRIVYTDVEVEEITVVEDIPYETTEGETKTVETGYYHEEQEGSEGTAQITYQVKNINGVEQSREEIDRVVVQEPINRVILWGTAKASSKDDGNSGTSDGSDYDDIKVSNPGDQATNPSIPASPASYMEIMSGHVTAYTHTGRTTATGAWPRSTRTLSNPGSCAVVPATIPYGSLLYVVGYGYCIAEDTGGFRHDPDRWNQIDLFMNTKDECMIWGRRRDVKVYILRRGY